MLACDECMNLASRVLNDRVPTPRRTSEHAPSPAGGGPGQHPIKIVSLDPSLGHVFCQTLVATRGGRRHSNVQGLHAFALAKAPLVPPHMQYFPLIPRLSLFSSHLMSGGVMRKFLRKSNFTNPNSSTLESSSTSLLIINATVFMIS